MSLRNWLIVGVFLAGSLTGLAQDQQAGLEKVIPVSPTAASIAKYGNTPVSYYTGSPSISIPLFDVGVGSLKVPIALNYQYNGLKVEEIASWVGLGWSLQSGGVISRSVRGIPDEDTYGYMTIALSGQMTTKFMIDSMLSPTHEANIKYNLKQAGKGLYDTEADIFNFSFPGYSGKFFYDQEQLKFRTLPAQNLDITYDGSNFNIITESGLKYKFSIKEITTSSNTQCSAAPMQASGAMMTSSWYLSKIFNNTLTDSISFEYTDVNYSFDNLAASSKYILILYQGQVAGGATPPDFNQSLCWQTTTLAAKRLSYIRFRNGYLKFSVFSTERCDLPGEKALEKIELFNLSDQLIKRYRLSYGYFGGGSDYGTCSGTAVSQRLKLKSVTEENSSGTSLNPHSFEYEESGTFPGRLSYAQDHWGYYNGVTTNTSLIPTTYWQDFQGNARYVAGDNRKPDFNYSKLGTLKKLVYPTKGSTEFLYEGNEVNDPSLQPEFNIHTEFLEGDHVGTQTSYEKTFVVNESSNYYNFFNSSGGAYVDINFEAIGCTFPSGASTCAILTIEGVSPGAPGYGPFTHSLQGTYLPNGTYKLKAVFNQSPPMFADFYYWITWRQPILTGSFPVGGLRIKKITDYDEIDAAKKVVRVYSYSDSTTGLSSGKINGVPSYYTTDFIHEFYSAQYFGTGCVSYGLARNYKKITSTSNYPLVASQGSYVGYEYVTESLGENAENGKSFYKYKQFTDIISNYPSFVTSREWQRGMQLEDNKYAKTGVSTFTRKAKSAYTYSDLRDVDASIVKVALGLKPYYEKSVTIQSTAPCGPAFLWAQLEDNASLPSTVEYETITGYSSLASKSQTQYENGSQLQVVEEMTYHPGNYNPKEIKSSNSESQSLITRTKFNLDYTLVSGQPAWLQQLLNKKVLSAPVEKLSILKKSDGTEYVTGGLITQFRTDKPVPEKMFVMETATPILLSSFTQSYVDGSGNFVKDSRYKERVSFNGYDQFNNLLSQQKTSDNNTAYLWGYQSVYPIAEVINANSNEIFYDGFENEKAWDIYLYKNNARAHSGSYSGVLNGTSYDPWVISFPNNWLSISLSAPTKYKYSGWVYSDGPQARLILFMKRAGETGYYTYVDVLDTYETGKWVYLEKEYTVPADITQLAVRLDNMSNYTLGKVWFDDLRLHPSAAQMKTVTYEPFVGMTSMGDANNQYTYYEYDGFGRLTIVRDNNKNILKKICYNYAGQTESCPFDATPQWLTTGVTRCQPCSANPTFISNILEHQEKDNNLNSATYNTFRWIADGVSSSCVPEASWQNTATALRCKVVSGSNTGEREQEQQDMNPCSPTGGQTRWVVVDQNCASCPKPAVWQSTGSYRCVTSGGNNTGAQEREERDNESCSATYNQTRWVSNGTNCATCPKPSNWQSTGNYRCVTIDGGNTGGQEREERDNESCSSTYNQTRWVSNGTNCTSCPKPETWQVTGNYRCVTSGGNNNGAQEREERNTESCSSTYNQTRWVSNGTNCATCPKPSNWQSTGNYRCITSGGNNTGEQEREERDNESCSSTYNQTRWVSNGTNCATCPKPSNWQSTGNYRCAKDGSNNNTGYQEREERDNESCSATYNQTRWVNNGLVCSTCPKLSNWQSTGSYRCVTDAGGNYTGYQERQERDNESCSATYNQTRWVSNGYNPTACVPCSASCSGQGYKCINNNCELGFKVYTGSNYNSFTGWCERWYHYEWSDGSWSTTYSESYYGECPSDS